MDLRQLRYFSVLAAHRHFGTAARHLFIAQPALSRQIRALEEELGATLFERHARGATPTQNALMLLERANFILRYAEQMKTDMQALHMQPEGQVTLGLSPGLAAFLTAPLAIALKRDYPGVRLKVVEVFTPALHYQLADGTVDLAIISGPKPQLNIRLTPLFDEKICAIGPATDKRLGKRVLSIKHMRDIPLILAGVPGSGIRSQLDMAAQNAGLSLNQVIEVGSHDVARSLVEAGLGWTVHFAAPVQEHIESGVLRAVPIQGLRLRRSLAQAVERPISRATQVVMEVMRDVAISMVAQKQWPHSEPLTSRDQAH